MIKRASWEKETVATVSNKQFRHLISIKNDHKHVTVAEIQTEYTLKIRDVAI
jgi:hypothetical protein